jgi:hypothetical protein
MRFHHRSRAARIILNQASRAMEIEDVEVVRVSLLEQAMESDAKKI